MNKKKIVVTFLLAVGLALSLSNCVKNVSTPGFSGSYVPAGVVERGFELSEEEVDNCMATTQNLAGDEPNSRVECEVTTNRARIEYEPRYPSNTAGSRPRTSAPRSPPANSGSGGGSRVNPPTNPPVTERAERLVRITNQTAYLKTVEIMSGQGESRVTHDTFNLEPGQSRSVSLLPGTYNLRIEGDPAPQYTTLVVGNNRNQIYTID